MSRTSYCKKCGKDFEVTDRCPECGAKLTAAAVRSAWCTPNVPVKDWMSWNAVMRLAIPAFATGCLLIFLMELASGGPGALERMLKGGFLPLAGLVLLLLTAGTFLVLALRGRELLDCVLDSKGAHVSVYLTDPTPMKLLLRFRSPSLLAGADTNGRVPVLLLTTRDISWKEVSRVQLWPQKALILLYSPTWWMRLPLQATPFDWDDALDFIREKLGRKKTVTLPGVLVAPPKPRKPAAKPNQAAIPAEAEDLPYSDSEAAESEPDAEPAGRRRRQTREEEANADAVFLSGTAEEETSPAEDIAPEDLFRENPVNGQLSFTDLPESEPSGHADDQFS